MIWILLVLQLVTLVVVGLIRYDQRVRKGKVLAAPTPAQSAKAQEAVAARVLATGTGRALLRERVEARIRQAEHAANAPRA